MSYGLTPFSSNIAKIYSYKGYLDIFSGVFPTWYQWNACNLRLLFHSFQDRDFSSFSEIFDLNIYILQVQSSCFLYKTKATESKFFNVAQLEMSQRCTSIITKKVEFYLTFTYQNRVLLRYFSDISISDVWFPQLPSPYPLMRQIELASKEAYRGDSFREADLGV